MTVSQQFGCAKKHEKSVTQLQRVRPIFFFFTELALGCARFLLTRDFSKNTAGKNSVKNYGERLLDGGSLHRAQAEVHQRPKEKWLNVLHAKRSHGQTWQGGVAWLKFSIRTVDCKQEKPNLLPSEASL